MTNRADHSKFDFELTRISFALCVYAILNRITAGLSAVILSFSFLNPLKQTAGFEIFSAFLNLIFSALPAVIGIYIANGSFKLCREKGKFTKKDFSFTLLGLGAISAGVFLTYISNKFLLIFSVKPPYHDTDILTVLLSVPAKVIVIPILEELFFRKTIYGKLKSCSVIFAAAFSSLLFAFAHNSFSAFLTALFFGLVLCFVYENTHSILCAFIIHAANNLFSVLSLIISERIFIYISILLTVSAICILVSNRRKYKFKPENDIKNAAYMFKKSFSSILIIFFMAISIIFAFLNATGR